MNATKVSSAPEGANVAVPELIVLSIGPVVPPFLDAGFLP